MIRVRCEEFPQLLVTTPHVQFVDGAAVVSDAVAKELEKLPIALSFEKQAQEVKPIARRGGK